MEAVKPLLVNTRQYTLRMFSPLEAVEYMHDRAHAERNRLNQKTLILRAIGQCNDEMGRSLKEQGNFEANFSKYPEDLLPLGDLANKELVRPFVGNGGATSGTATT